MFRSLKIPALNALVCKCSCVDYSLEQIFLNYLNQWFRGSASNI